MGSQAEESVRKLGEHRKCDGNLTKYVAIYVFKLASNITEIGEFLMSVS
jgi:hypothetical protein